MLSQPKADLYDRVINRINQEEKIITLRKRLILRSAGLLLSVFALVPLAFKLFTDVANSGFSQFSSLLFSDFSIIMANIGDYVLSLLELMPALSLSLALTALLSVIFYAAKVADVYADFKKIIIN